MNLKINNISLSAITAAVPSMILNLEELFGEREVQRISAVTGISSVRVAGLLTTADLCEAAARQIISKTCIDPSSIDGLILVTQTPDQLMPGTAFEIHKRLGLSKDCVVFDINHGCSGYVYGLLQAGALVAAGCQRVLLCTGDVISKMLDPADRKVRMVFGDAGSASLIEEGRDCFEFSFRSDGNGISALSTPNSYSKSSDEKDTLTMDGNRVMEFALTQVPPLINALLNRTNTTLDQISLFGMHQANQFILDYLGKLLGIDKKRIPSYINDIGNTGPSSIPLMLSARANNLDTPPDLALLCGFGVGLSIGAVQLSLSRTLFIPPVNINI